MSDDAEDIRPVGGPRTSAGMPTWVKWLLGCLGVTLLLACVAAGLIGYGIYWAGRSIQQTVLDRLHREAFADGDAGRVYDNADPAFRHRYSHDEWFQFAAKHPHLFDRATLDKARTETRYYQDNSYRLVQVTLPDGQIVKFVFRLVGGALVLAGLSPLLDAALPAGLLEAFDRPEPSRGRDLFDD